MSGLTSSQCEEDDVEILILMTGTDDTFNQTVHSRSSYSGDEILFRPRFKQIIDRGDDGVVTIDIDRLSDVEETNAA